MPVLSVRVATQPAGEFVTLPVVSGLSKLSEKRVAACEGGTTQSHVARARHIRANIVRAPVDPIPIPPLGRLSSLHVQISFTFRFPSMFSTAFLREVSDDMIVAFPRHLHTGCRTLTTSASPSWLSVLSGVALENGFTIGTVQTCQAFCLLGCSPFITSFFPIIH